MTAAAVDQREAAREAYLRAVAEGAELSGRALGEAFGRSERWGRDRIAEVRRAAFSPVSGRQEQRQDDSLSVEVTAPIPAASEAADGHGAGEVAVPVPAVASVPRRAHVGTVVAVAAVAAVAAVVSYFHMRDLALSVGEGWRAWLLPFAVDGLLVAAALSMRQGRRPTALAWVALVLGIGASLAANVAAAEPTLVGRVVAAWPPIALAVAFELAMQQVRDGGEPR